MSIRRWSRSKYGRPLRLALVLVVLLANLGIPLRPATVRADPFEDFGKLLLEDIEESCVEGGGPLPNTNADATFHFETGPANPMVKVTLPQGFFFGYSGGPASGAYAPGQSMHLMDTNVEFNVTGEVGATTLTAPAGQTFFTFHYTDPNLGECIVTGGGHFTLNQPLPPLATDGGGEDTLDVYVSFWASDTQQCSFALRCHSLRDAYDVARQFLSPGKSAEIHVSRGLYYGASFPVNFEVPAGTTIIVKGSGKVKTVLDGQSISQLFHVSGPGSLEVSDVTLQHGSGTWGGAVWHDGPGSLWLHDVNLRENHAVAYGGGLGAYGGSVRVEQATFAYNEAGDEGGALWVGAGVTATVNSSLLKGNTAPKGAAAYVEEGSLAFTQGTIWANGPEGGPAAGSWALQLGVAGGDEGHQAMGSVTATGTILGPNLVPNCHFPLVSGGHNLDSGNSCGLNGSGDLVNTDPQLAGPDFFGGGVEAVSFLSTSPARNGGGSTCPATDVRGVPRPQESACDIGAFEAAASTTDLVVVSATASTSTAAAGDTLTLTVVVRNDAGTASGAGLRIDLSGLEAVSADVSAGAPGADPNRPYWLIGTLGPGAEATLTLEVKQASHSRSVATFTARAYERNASAGKNVAVVVINPEATMLSLPGVASDR